jgi:hypothetical protein
MRCPGPVLLRRPYFVEEAYYEVRVRGFSEVIAGRSLESGPSRPWVAKIFGPAKPLLLRVAITSPCNKPWSCHNASACS